MRPIIVVVLILSAAVVGCFRQPWKKEPLPLPPSKLPDPQVAGPVVPAGGREKAEPPPAQVKPPQIDIPAGEIPALPGMPKATIPNSIPDTPDAPPLASVEPIAAPRLPPIETVANIEQKKPAGKGNVAEVRKLLDAAVKTYADVPDYEAKLVRREVVSGRATPTEEILYAHRKEPFSVYMQVTGEAGKGREMLYVKGQNGGKLVIVTGKGDNALLGAGKRMELDPDSSLITAKSRNRIYDAGMGKMLANIAKYVEQAEAGKRSPETVRFLGSTESPAALTSIELVLLPGDEPLLPKGGSRTYGFDADKKSPAYGLPVQIVVCDDKGKEVEFYSFSHFRLPAKFTDADFSPDRLGGKKK